MFGLTHSLWFIIPLCVVLVIIAFAVVTSMIANRMSQKRHEKWLRNWSMPADVTRISGKYLGYSYNWPRVVQLEMVDGSTRTLYMSDYRKVTTFEPDLFKPVTFLIREADPTNNRHAELWWADYGDFPDPGEAVKAAEDIIRR
jgi:hypothetical protein